MCQGSAIATCGGLTVLAPGAVHLVARALQLTKTLREPFCILNAPDECCQVQEVPSHHCRLCALYVKRFPHHVYPTLTRISRQREDRWLRCVHLADERTPRLIPSLFLLHQVNYRLTDWYLSIRRKIHFSIGEIPRRRDFFPRVRENTYGLVLFPLLGPGTQEALSEEDAAASGRNCACSRDFGHGVPYGPPLSSNHAT